MMFLPYPEMHQKLCVSDSPIFPPSIISTLQIESYFVLQLAEMFKVHNQHKRNKQVLLRYKQVRTPRTVKSQVTILKPPFRKFSKYLRPYR